MKDTTAQEDLDITSTHALQEPMEPAELERKMLESASHALQETTAQKPVPHQQRLMQATTQCSQVSHQPMLCTSAHLATIVLTQV